MVSVYLCSFAQLSLLYLAQRFPRKVLINSYAVCQEETFLELLFFFFVIFCLLLLSPWYTNFKLLRDNISRKSSISSKGLHLILGASHTTPNCQGKAPYGSYLIFRPRRLRQHKFSAVTIQYPFENLIIMLGSHLLPQRKQKTPRDEH